MSEFQAIHFDGGSDGLACSHCGVEAVWPDEDGHFLECWYCENCGIEGDIVEGEFRARPGATCERDVCGVCT